MSIAFELIDVVANVLAIALALLELRRQYKDRKSGRTAQKEKADKRQP